MDFDSAVDKAIQQNLQQLQKPGVLLIRPGYKSTGGKLTDRPAIVVTVDNKQADIAPEDRVPPQVGGYPTDVRQADRMQRLRAANPADYALEAATAPPELQRPAFPFERNATGQLVAPAIAAAAAAVAARKPAKDPLKYTPPKDRPLDPITGQFTITCHASPDAGWPTLKPFIEKTTQRLSVAMYECTAPYIVETVIGSLKGKKLELVLDHPADPVKREQTDDDTRAQLVAGLGPALSFAWALAGDDPHASAAIFPRAYHIKVIVRDGTALWLSSGNLNRTNQPDIDPTRDKAGADRAAPDSDRDWHVIVEHAGLASLFEAYINNDFVVASQHQMAGATPPSAVLSPQATPPAQDRTKVPVEYFEPKQITANMTIQPVLTPDNYEACILPLIRGAKKTFLMQTQYISPPKSAPQPGTPAAQSDAVLEELIAAIAKLISDNVVDVRLIFSQYETQDKLELLQERGIPQKNIRIQKRVHNKGIVVDSSIVVVGSQNWSGEGVSVNRDASLIIHNNDAAQYWQKIFEHDWQHMVEAGGFD